MPSKTVTAILIDANGFEKRVDIPMESEVAGPQPFICVPDHRRVRLAQLRLRTCELSTGSPFYEMRFKFTRTYRVASDGKTTHPLYEEVL